MSSSVFKKNYNADSDIKKIFLRYEIIYSKCKNASLFEMPRPLRYDNQAIYFERVNDFSSVCDLFSSSEDFWACLFRCWQVLAEFHLLLNSDYDFGCDWFLHGDFGCGNLLVDSSNVIWIIDCEVPSDNSGNLYGSYYEDITKFLIYIREWGSLLDILMWFDTIDLEVAFLKWYEKIIGKSLVQSILEDKFRSHMKKKVKNLLKQWYYSQLIRIVFWFFKYKLYM